MKAIGSHASKHSIEIVNSHLTISVGAAAAAARCKERYEQYDQYHCFEVWMNINVHHIAGTVGEGQQFTAVLLHT